MNLGLAGQRVVLCGANGVLGRAIAKQLAAEGATLALLGRSRDALATLAGELADTVTHATIECDLAEPNSTDRAIEQAEQALGGIDVFISAAGAAQGGVFWEIDDAAWRSNLEIKLFGTIRALRAVTPRMVKQRNGRIVLVVGNSARQPEPRMLPGAAANAALLAIVRGLAEELGPHGVAINAVNPGPVRSSRWNTLMQAAAAREGCSVAEAETRFLEKTALRRLATAEEIATHVAFFASPAAAHLTGTSLTIDGGSTKSP
ncbi:MAG: SDR family oxidoreductase [Gammaproteobacteria bacterium]|jgi:NAD(P)-dependent dehydrogenase (short-subunit alcohol dehydrogenase family)|nr:SDR family oxidoreductase [Gammaproteobacteria bacterium]